MATIRTDKIYSGVLDTTETTIVTVAANTVFVIKGIWISNSNASNKYALLKIDDKRFIPSTPILSKNTLIQDNLNIAVASGKTIKITGEVASDMDYYIWGIEEVTS